MELNFSNLQTDLSELSDQYHLSEWHGVLSGLLCTREAVAVDSWVELAMSRATGDAGHLEARHYSMLDKVYQHTQRQIYDALFDFQLLLPEEEPLAERTAALAAWCQGFLFGLSAGGLNKDMSLSADVAELLADLTELSKAELGSDEAGSEDEYHYFELVEYVRIGALLIKEELAVPSMQASMLH